MLQEASKRNYGLLLREILLVASCNQEVLYSKGAAPVPDIMEALKKAWRQLVSTSPRSNR